MESSKNKQVKKIYIICGIEFIGHFNAKVCSEKCRLEKINYYKVDLINLQNRHIIEFFGDYWHCNPIKYKPNDYNRHNKKTAQEIWDYDKERIKSLEFLGYKVLIIWEYDYIHNTNNIFITIFFR